jgi:NADPH:quinone reductase-like Zn-dependent oxidoreductase
MRAAIVGRYGPPDVVVVGETPMPTPAAGEILVKVHATTVSRTDCGRMRGHPVFTRLFYGLRRPKPAIFGVDFAGKVEAVGPGVTAFAPGERVFGMCGSASEGAQADYVCVRESLAAKTPAGVSSEAAVIGEGAFYAHTILEMIGLKSGDGILVYGGSGAIGVALTQLAKARGARVTAVVGARHLELARSLGADCVIDFSAEDFTHVGERFEFVVDAVGKTTYPRCRRLLKPGGIFAATDMGPGGQTLILAIWCWLTRSRRVMIPAPRRIGGFVEVLKDRMEAGQIRAVIDRAYPLADIAEAYRYVETGQKTGIVVVSISQTGG